MAVQSGPTEKRYAANGVTTIYTIPFLLLYASDLQVLLNGVPVTSGYTLAGVGNPASTITFTAAPIGDLLLQLVVPFERLADYQENGDFLSQTVNRDFDRIWQALKQLLRFAGRALTLGVNDIDGAGAYRARNNRISDLADPVDYQDAATNGWTQRLIANLLGAGQGSINLAQNILYALTPGGITRTVDDRLDDYLTAPGLGCVGDGGTNDTAAFTGINANYQNRVIDLAGRTYSVSEYPARWTFQNPTGNIFVNGKFNVAGVLVEAEIDGWVIVSATDTGQLETPNNAGMHPGPSGRSNGKTFGVLLSGNSRSWGQGGACSLAGIHNDIHGNRSLGAACRLARINGAQSAVIASEEGDAYGPKGFFAASIYGSTRGEHGAIIATRRGETSASFCAAIASVGVSVGGGRGARFTPNVVNGQIDSLTIVDGGIGYPGSGSFVFWDKGTGQGSGAAYTFAVDANGVVVSTSKVNGGVNYSDVIDVYLLGVGTYSAILSSSDNCFTYGERNTLAGCSATVTRFTASLALGSDGSEAAALRSGVILSTGTKATGSNSLGICGSQSVSAGVASLTLMTSYCSAYGDYSTVISSRRTRVNDPGVLVMGDANSGIEALVSNTKIRLEGRTGNVKITGVLTQNAVFTDIAKMMENMTRGEIPRGGLVALDGDTIRPAVEGDLVFSARSDTYVQLLGDSALGYAKKYETGLFGEALYEMVADGDWKPYIESPDWQPVIDNPAPPVYEMEPLFDEEGEPTGLFTRILVSERQIPNPEPPTMIPNPVSQEMVRQLKVSADYDEEADQEHVKRSERPEEWTAVAMLGEVHVMVDSSVSAKDFVRPSSTPLVGTNADEKSSMYCKRITSPFDAERGYAVALCMVCLLA